jgi:hypothetical protein
MDFPLTQIWKDGRTLTDGERAGLANLNYLVLVEMRILGREGKAEQVKDLAEASHNVPMTMWRDDFSVTFHRTAFQRYHEKYGPRPFDCVAELHSIFPPRS